jgi:hypothetical protein
MTGFKDGATPSGLESNDQDQSDEPDDTQLESPRQNTSEVEIETESVSETTQDKTGEGLPWIYRRSSITDGREKTVQLHLQQTTLDDEYTTKSEIEDRLAETVNKADLREAAYLVGLAHLDELTEQLRQWGYDAD